MDDPQLCIVFVLRDVQFVGTGIGQHESAGGVRLSAGSVLELEPQFACRRSVDPSYPVAGF